MQIADNKEEQMYFHSPEELKGIIPICNGVWNRDYLYEYLVWSCNMQFEEYINCFFDGYLHDESLADMLFSFLLSDDYDGSDSQMGAARLISRMDRQLLRQKKNYYSKHRVTKHIGKGHFPMWRI